MSMPVVLVGCGRMGGALLRGWRAAGIGPVHVIDPAVREAPGAQLLHGYADVAELPGPLCIVIAVKPARVAEALAALGPALSATGALVISIAAGVRLDSLRQAAGAGPAIVRAMPNIPAAIGRGVMAAVAGEGLDPERRAVAERLLGAAGEVVWLDEEAMIDAVTAISGAGPAYFYRFTEALAQAGRALGLPGEMADRLAELTFTGSAALLEGSGRDPADLRVEVTSPGGVTAAALAKFDAEGGLDALVLDAVRSGLKRSREMGG